MWSNGCMGIDTTQVAKGLRYYVIMKYNNLCKTVKYIHIAIETNNREPNVEHQRNITLSYFC